jgi:hypothetical protein
MPHGTALPHRAIAQRRVGPDPNPVSMRVDAALKRACCVANGWRRWPVDARLRSKAINLLGTLRERTAPRVCNDYASISIGRVPATIRAVACPSRISSAIISVEKPCASIIPSGQPSAAELASSASARRRSEMRLNAEGGATRLVGLRGTI